MRRTSVGLGLTMLICSTLIFSCDSSLRNSKIREYSAELVFPFSMDHPVFEEVSYDKLVVKVFASQGRIRLDAPNRDFVVIYDSGTQEGRLLLNRDRPKLTDTPNANSTAQPELRKFIRLPPRGDALFAWPQLIVWTTIALRFTPPPPDKPRDVCSSFKDGCRKLGEETIAGRATEQWEIRESGELTPAHMWFDKELGIPVKRTGDAELRNIVQARQEPTLFSLPEGYEEMR